MNVLRAGLTAESLLDWKKEVTCQHCDALLSVALSDVQGEFFDKSLYVICPCCKQHVRLAAPEMVRWHVFPKMRR